MPDSFRPTGTLVQVEDRVVLDGKIGMQVNLGSFRGLYRVTNPHHAWFILNRQDLRVIPHVSHMAAAHRQLWNNPTSDNPALVAN